MTDGLLTSPEGTLLILVIAILAHEPFRWLGLYLGHGLDAQSEIFAWVRAVATALVAGLVTRLVLFPVGALNEVSLLIRLTAFAAGIGIFLGTKRHLGAGVFGSASVLLAMQFLMQ
jgi:branched-subunit amino acid transport protein AzlD